MELVVLFNDPFTDLRDWGDFASIGAAIIVTSSEILANGIGIDKLGGPVTINDTHITLNGTAISGPTSSFGNNRIFGSGAAGTTPTHISPEKAE